MTWVFPPDVESEFAPCNHCGSADERELFCGPDLLHNLPGTFRVVECTACGWIRQNPRPTIESINRYYPSNYINFTPAIEDAPRFWKRWDHRYGMLKERWAIERAKPKGRILDVGCATGNFLREMQRAGWDAVGVEPNSGAASYARQRFGLSVHIGTLCEAAFPAESFDVITFIDVFEHLHNPWDNLQEVYRILSDEGLLIIRIPNLESIDAQWFGPVWLGWDLPRHLYFVSRSNLIKSLNDLGLNVAKIGNASGSYPTFMLMLQAYLQHLYPQPKHWSKLVVRFGRTMPARLAFAPLFWALDRAHLTTNITLFAEKRIDWRSTVTKIRLGKLANLMRNPRVRRWSSAATLGLTLAFLVVLLVRERQQLNQFEDWRLYLAACLQGLALYPLSLGIQAVVWSTMMAKLGQVSEWWRNIEIYAYTYLLRQLPGAVWYLAGRTVIYGSHGVAAAVTLVASGFEWLLLLAVAAFLYGTLSIPNALLRVLCFVLLLPLVSLGLYGLEKLRSTQRRVPGFARRWLDRLFSVQMPSTIDLVLWLGSYITCYAIGGLILFLLVRSVAPQAELDVVSATRIFTLLNGASFVWSLIIPLGMGVRELTLTALLVPRLSPTSALLVSVLMRLLFTVGDLVWGTGLWGLARLLGRRQEKGIL